MKKIIIAMLILLAIMTLTAVSAGENQTDEVMASSENTTVELESAQPQDVISDTPGNFTDLETLISSASAGDTITLSKDYEYNEGFSTAGITINKKLTIEGAGHTIDAQVKSKIFTITAPEVILNNIKFINAGSSGALTVTGDDVVIANSTFTNCYSTGSGSAVHSTADNMLITNSTFTNCTSDANGGAVYIGGDAGMISDSTFSNCTASNGGAVYFNWEEGKSMRVSQSVFSNNAADDLGGAIYNCDFEDCIFESNTEPEIYLDYALRKPLNITADVANILVGEDLTVIINLFPNISAPITVMINDTTVYESEINGTVIFTVENLTSGEYELSAICNGSIVYAPAFSHVMFTVSKYDPVMNVSASNLVYGENAVVSVNLPADATGYVSVYVDGKNYMNPAVVDGKVSFLIPGLAAGSHVCNVGYEGDRKYNGAMNSTMFTISKLIPAMNVSADDAYFGEDVSVMIYLPADATGNVSVIVNAIEYNSDVVDGEASLNIHNLETGTYCGIVTYPGDLNYNGAVANITFEVKHNTFSQLQELINDDVTGTLTLDRDYYGEGTQITISKSITIDGNGHTLNANGLSRIFNVQSDGVVISNLVLVNGTVEGDGGAVYFNGAGTVINCNFTDNTATYDAGAVYFQSTGNVSNCNFTGNTASRGGGAVYFVDSGTVLNCNFTSNYARNGGAIYFLESGTVTNCNFTNNSATNGNGGAVFFDGTGNVTNCNFTNNRALSSGSTSSFGGAIRMSSGSVTNCNFTNNFARYGGAIRFIGESTVTNCNFIGNNVTYYGGAIDMKSSNITNCNFTNNFARYGGAIRFSREGTLINCNFVNNTAEKGGAIYFLESGTVTNCNFTNNSATNGNGGAIYMNDGTVTNCNFVNNTASEKGGAIYFNINLGTLTNCNFTNNTASYSGGAVYFYSTGTVTNCNFTGNTASYGGAICFYSTGNVTNCIFTANSAENGGAIYCRGNATDSVFTNNAASNLGGAIYNCNYEGCIFKSNSEPEIYFDEELRKEVNLTISAENISYGEILTVNVVLSGGISANLTATLGGTNMVVTVVNGTGNLQVAGLNAGEHNLTVTYSGTYEYRASNSFLNFDVAKSDPVMNVSANDAYFGEDVSVMIYLPADTTGNVSVIVNAIEYNLDVVNGEASLNIHNLETGTYCGIVTYPGDLNYNGAVANITFKVKHHTFSQLQELINNDVTGTLTLDRDYYGEGTEITISKTITIDGNGHTLNANGLSRIFNVQSDGVVISNLVLVNGTVEGNGGAVYFNGGGAVINCYFTGNNATGDYSYGGALYFLNQGTVSNCNFTGNTANVVGGAVWIYSGSVSNCNFTGNTASYSCGAVYFYTGNVTNCNFVDNKATAEDSWGGAINMVSGSVTNCNFAGNTANDDGGAVYFENSGNVTNCNFAGNTANDDGGAISIYSGTVTNCNFTDNTATSNGSAINMGYGSVSNCNFTGNTANVDGGAVWIYSGSVTNCNFTGNTANVDGGAVWIYSGSVSNCNFTGNTAVEGGAIFALNKLVVDDSTFDKNSAEGGAAIFISDKYVSTSLSVNNCNFAENNVSDGGGAILVDASYGNGAVYIINGCKFIKNVVSTAENSSVAGGAVYVEGISEGNISNNVFIGNKADSPLFPNGGAIKAQFGAKMSIVECTFEENEAYSGGAIDLQGNTGMNPEATIINCLFRNNKADAGGAIACLQNIGNSQLTVKDSHFITNEATIYGGAIYSDDLSTVNVTSSEFEGNNATNGGAVYFNGAGNVSNCIFTANSAENGGAIYGRGNATDSVFTNNAASNLGGAIYNCNYEDCIFESNTEPEIYFDEELRKEVNLTISAEDISYGEILTVNVVLSGGISANLTATLGGKNMNVAVVNGTGNLHVAGLNAGEHFLTVTYSGTYEYKSCSVNFTFLVSTRVPAAVIETSDIMVGQDEVVTVTFNENITGIATVQISPAAYEEQSQSGNGTISPGSGPESIMNISVVIVDGKGNLSVNNLPSGKYTATLYFHGNENYNSTTASSNFTVSRYPVLLNVNVDDINVGENPVVNFIFNETVNGNVTVTVWSVGQGVKAGFPAMAENGSGSFTIPYVLFLTHYLYLSEEFKAGNYSVMVEFNGNEHYNPVKASTNFTAFKCPVLLNVNVDDINVGENPVVNFIFNETVSGNVTVIVQQVGHDTPTNFTVKLENGTGSFTIPYILSNEEFAAGDYSVRVVFNGNDGYNPVNASSNFTVLKLNPIINVIFNNDDKTITLTPPADITGNTELIVGGKSYFTGSTPATFDLSGLASGNYTYTVSYPGDDRHNPYSASANITLTRQEVNVMVGVENITYGDSQNVTATVPEGATGDVVFVLYRNNVSVWNTSSKPQSGVATCQIPDLDAGTYTLKSSYAGDSSYERSELVEKTFRVNPNINIQPRVKIGDNGLITIEVGDIEGSIAVSVDDRRHGSGDIFYGSCVIYLRTDVIAVGYHNLTFQYSGKDLDENVFKSWDSKTQSYTPTKYMIYISQRQAQAAQNSDMDKVFTLVLEEDGVELTNATGNVTFVILDEYNKEVGRVVVEVVNGIAQLDISRYKNGNYLISWTYSGDEKYEPISRSMKMDIEHKASRIDAGDLKIQYTLSKLYSLTVYGEDSKPLSNAKVEILANNKVLANVRTNANGEAAIRISYIPGTYNLVIKTPGKTLTKKLTVTHLLSLKTVKVKRSAKKLVLTATLAKVNGKYLKAKKITFKFNGKKYTAKTNKKGVAKVTIKKKVLKKLKKGKKVKYQATYLKDTVKKTAKVKK